MAADVIAERVLKFTRPGASQLDDLVVRVFRPEPVETESAGVEVSRFTASCRWEIVGLPEPVADTVLGADSLQALQLASDLEGVLKALSARYDLYFPSGEPYFGP